MTSTIPFVVFSDLDGIWFDRHTGSCDHAAAVLDMLDRLDVPLVLCSGKPQAEVERIRQLFGLRHPYVAGPAATVFVPHGYFTEDPEAIVTGDISRSVGWLAVRYRLALGPVVTIGLGATLAHLPLLRSVDVPLVVEGDTWTATAQLLAALPHARLTGAASATGWSSIVLDLLQPRLFKRADRMTFAHPAHRPAAGSTSSGTSS